MTRSEAGKLGYQKSKKSLEEKKQARINVYLIHPTTCNFCGKVLDYIHRRDKFCSHSCSAKKNNLGVCRANKDKTYSLKIKRYCLHCGKEAKKKFCSLKCCGEHYSKLALDAWKEGRSPGVTGKTLMTKRIVRKYLIEQVDNKCSKCGWNKKNPVTNTCPLEINHIDGNAENCTLANLEVLCPNCHSLTHNFRNLNKTSKRNRKASLASAATARAL